MLGTRLIEDIQYQRGNYFYFLGKVADGSGVLSDTLVSENVSRSEMVTFKKIAPSDVSHVVRRIDWTLGTVYDQYDNSVDLTDKNFYVMSSDFDVYKCLNNRNGRPSTESPYGTEVVPFETSDGIMWKYMYSVAPFKRQKFVSALRIPVQVALSDRFYNRGSIFDAVVLTGGTGYLDTDTTTVTVVGDGTGASLTPVFSGGQLVDLIINTPGIGYTYAEATITTDGLGVNARVSIVLGTMDFLSEQGNVEQTALDGAIHNIVVTEMGNSYTVATVEITGDGTGATATAVLVAGQLSEIRMTTIGSGYTYANVSITGDNRTNDPNAVNARARAIIAPPGGHGSDAVAELYADTVCLFSGIRTQSSIGSISQDFREYGIVKNPRDALTNALVTRDNGLCTYSVVMDTVVDLVKDEILFRGNSQLRVVDIFGGNVVILSPMTKNPLLIGDTLAALNNISREYLVSNIQSQPQANKWSGQMLFVSDSDAFTFTSEQEVTIKTFLQL